MVTRRRQKNEIEIEIEIENEMIDWRRDEQPKIPLSSQSRSPELILNPFYVQFATAFHLSVVPSVPTRVAVPHPVKVSVSDIPSRALPATPLALVAAKVVLTLPLVG